jgi:hypothetical protein
MRGEVTVTFKVTVTFGYARLNSLAWDEFVIFMMTVTFG